VARAKRRVGGHGKASEPAGRASASTSSSSSCERQQEPRSSLRVVLDPKALEDRGRGHVGHRTKERQDERWVRTHARVVVADQPCIRRSAIAHDRKTGRRSAAEAVLVNERAQRIERGDVREQAQYLVTIVDEWIAGKLDETGNGPHGRRTCPVLVQNAAPESF
jgi:hypothetical protein